MIPKEQPIVWQLLSLLEQEHWIEQKLRLELIRNNIKIEVKL